MYATSILVNEELTRDFINNATAAPQETSKIGITFPMGMSSKNLHQTFMTI